MERSLTFSGFEYVVERKEADPICFGSKLPRITTPNIKKGSSKLGPGYYPMEKYNTALGQTLDKVRSKKGVGPLASDDPRFKDKILMRVPSPTRYNIKKDWTRAGRCAPPFGSKTTRKPLKENILPGPGTYNFTMKKCRRTRFMSNFGYPEMIPTIEIICVTIPTDTCVKCEEICKGDYWQRDYSSYLCHLCWEEEKSLREIYNEKELNLFKKIRNCTFAHEHEGTTAAIQLLPKSKIKKKLQLENYLDLYIKC